MEWFELFGILGKGITSVEVRNTILKYMLTDIEDDPPNRCYVGSRKNGLDFLVEDSNIVTIQIFVQSTQGFSEFCGVLPLGLQKLMSQKQVHQLLGVPCKSDEFDSRYEFQQLGVKLIINYDTLSVVKYLSIISLSAI